MCEGNLAMTAKLAPALASRFTNRCYQGGHMMYRDPSERRRLADDVRRFIAASSR
jgi:carboxypeptidase C (cathepsin A)